MDNKNKDSVSRINGESGTINSKRNTKKSSFTNIKGNKVLQGIIFSEILGKPKGKRGR